MSDLFGAAVKETRKNFSRNNLGQRRAGDFYQTPPSMTRQFLDALPVRHFPVLEPACGRGAIASVLSERYGSGKIIAYDILSGMDFLNEWHRWPSIVTNPPFSLSTEFILKCKEVATRRFSLLMPIDYLHGTERFERIFSARDAWSLRSLHVYVRRALMSGETREDGKYPTGMITWAWYTWTRGGPRASAPRIFWIDNTRFVLRAGS